MKFFITIILILIIALGLGGYFYYTLYFKTSSNTNSFLNGPVTKEAKNFSFELSNPDDKLLLFEKSVVISGKSSPKAIILISSQSTDVGLQADEKGDFSKVFDLTPGLNELKITAFDENGNTKEFTRSIFYSEEKI